MRKFYTLSELSRKSIKAKIVFAVFGFVGLIGAGAAAAIFLVPGAPGGQGQQPEATAKSEQLLDLDNLQPRSVKVRALMETAFEWNDDLEYSDSDFFKQKSAEIKEHFQIEFYH